MAGYGVAETWEGALVRPQVRVLLIMEWSSIKVFL